MASKLWEDGKQDTVQRFIDGVKERFQDYYKECGNVLVGFTPMVSVLASAGRDNLLTYAFHSALEQDGDTSELIKLAYAFGRRGSTGERLQSIAEPLGLTSEQSHRVYEAYQAGIDAAREEAPEQA